MVEKKPRILKPTGKRTMVDGVIRHELELAEQEPDEIIYFERAVPPMNYYPEDYVTGEPTKAKLENETSFDPSMGHVWEMADAGTLNLKDPSAPLIITQSDVTARPADLQRSRARREVHQEKEIEGALGAIRRWFGRGKK
jgi:hypothetical protein